MEEQRLTHVLFVHASSDLYGAGRSMVRLIRELSGGSFHFSVVLSDNGPLVDMLCEAKADVYVMRNLTVIRRQSVKSWRILPLFLNAFMSVFALRRVIRRLKVDVVHINTAVTPTAAIAAKLGGVGVIWHIREIFDDSFGLVWAPYRAFILRAGNLVVCVSKSVRQQFPLDASKVKVLYNGLKISDFDAILPEDDAIRQQFNIPKSASLVAMFSRIHPWKGQTLFIEAAALLRERLPDTFFLIVGDVVPGNERVEASIRERIIGVGMEDRIFLTGFMRDPRPLIAAVDIVVLPSTRPDPFPGIVLEGMALGRPIVATNVGGPTEQVIDGETGYLVPPEPNKLANAIEKLIYSPKLRSGFGRAARHRIVDDFNMSTLASEFAAIYQRFAPACAGKERPACD